jgi:predicted dehydrogenase
VTALRVAVIGGGLMGMRHARVLRGMPGVELAAVVDRAEEARRLVAAELGVPAMAGLDELWQHRPEAVVVSLPDDSHVEAALAALERGLPVLVEKPLATSVEDAERIVRAARGGLLMVGHLLRFDGRYLRARRLVADGQLGAVLHVYARRNSAVGAARRYGRSTRLTWHVSIHDIDLIRWVTGREVVAVTARGVSRGVAGRGHLDSLLALLELEDGAAAALESCWALPRVYRDGIDARLEVVGTQGAFEVEGLAQGLTVVSGDERWHPDTTRYVEHEDGAGGGILAAELAHFVRCVTGAARCLIDPQDAVAAVRVATAIERAIETGQRVPVPRAEEV